MGQQQLLLVILVTIIVGIATVVAINVFGTSAANANRDAVRQDMLGAIASAQGYYMKPVMMDGGGTSFLNMTIRDLSIPGQISNEAVDPVNDPELLIITNDNGTYELTAATDRSFTLTGSTRSGAGILQVVFTVGTDGRPQEPVWDEL